MLVNKSAIRRLTKKRGYRLSKEIVKALDEILESQIECAIEKARTDNKKTLKRSGVMPLFP